MYFLLQTDKLENTCRKLGVKMTLDRGQRTARIRLQGQTKDVYQAESRVKEMLHKIQAELIEQQRDAMLGQLVHSIFLLEPSRKAACNCQKYNLSLKIITFENRMSENAL